MCWQVFTHAHRRGAWHSAGRAPGRGAVAYRMENGKPADAASLLGVVLTARNSFGHRDTSPAIAGRLRLLSGVFQIVLMAAGVAPWHCSGVRPVYVLPTALADCYPGRADSSGLGSLFQRLTIASSEHACCSLNSQSQHCTQLAQFAVLSTSRSVPLHFGHGFGFLMALAPCRCSMP